MKTSKKNIFIQDTGIFFDEFVVCTGLSALELKKYAKKEKLVDSFYKNVFEDCDFTEEKSPKSAQTYYDTETNDVNLVSLGEYEDSWDFWSSVLHEVVHVVQRIEIKKGLQGEDEARAYLTDYLFTNIRRKLQHNKYPLKNI